MRLRTLVGLVGMCTVVGTAVSPSAAMAYPMLQPSASVVASSPAAVVEASNVACPADAGVVADGPLPKLTASLGNDLAAYAKNAPVDAGADAWIDSGGSFGGGVPAAAVRTLMRRGLAAGLDEAQVRGFLDPGFLRGMNDPRGGDWLFRFIAEQNDPALFQDLAGYAQEHLGRYVSPMSSQADIFESFPLLQAAYMAQARAIPPTQEIAERMLMLANQGYRPAQRTVQAFLAAGNHPAAGAQNSGGVADWMRASIYDYFVQSYTGPLSADARAAVANRGEYNAWVDRIATWVDDGADMTATPIPASFPAPVGATSGSSVEGAAPTPC